MKAILSKVKTKLTLKLLSLGLIVIGNLLGLEVVFSLVKGNLLSLR